jgi:UDP-2,3-diacylglucosamine pyrophosphatase LpxH
MNVDPDRRFVDGLCARRPRRLLVASDFHLCAGRDPATKAWPATENFLADEAFADWVDHCLREEPGTLLVLNGDTFDMVRVSEVPRGDELECWSATLQALDRPMSAACLERTLVGSEGRFGLRTDDFKSVWKLRRIMDAHDGFMRALAQWVAAGRDVLIILGNHDLELHWQLVRLAIRREVEKHGGDGRRVLFHDGHVVFDNVYIEHGHQYDPMTRVRGSPTLGSDHSQINLPLSAFLNRYLINGVEALDPFIDNVKPVQAALLRLVRQRPLRAVRKYFDAWRFVVRALVMRRLNASVALIALVLLMPFLLAPLYLPPPLGAALLAQLSLPDAAHLVIGLLTSLVVTGALPYVMGAVNDFRRRRPKRDRQLNGAKVVAGTALAGYSRRRAYVCMGHTHVVAIKRIPEAERSLYLNTGTWTALWPADRPDLLGQTVLTYASFERRGKDGYEAELLEWDEHGRRPRPATVLERDQGRRANAQSRSA